ncbi:MAG: AMP-binding protein, partial [Phycisphaerales bacterium]|nr:AMP-binding protein [Phycisphaerales bacterium]
ENAPFDQAWNVAVVGDELRIRVEYNSDLFDSATVVRMMGHFETLLESIVKNHDQKISRLALLTEAERHALIYDWNQTRIDYPNDQTIAQLFEAQAAIGLDRVAIEFHSIGARETQLSYRELNRRANQLAHYLIGLGVGPDVVVGICVERSLEMIVGLLGILKAGGAYVPLEPGYPSERLSFMLSDAALPVIVTQQKLVSRLPANGAKLVWLDLDGDSIAAQPDHNPVNRADANALAYVIYTSGSTGRPKGVCVPHRALTNLLWAMRDETAITEKDALLAVTTLSFDIAALELYLPLITGARLVLASREDAADGARLAGQLHDSGATVMQATPATWRLLLQSGWQGSASLNLLCGGEALSIDLADQLLERCLSLTNLYGPTETTIWSTAQRVAAGWRAIPLGR